MRLSPGKNPEYVCGGCGTRRPASKSSTPAEPHIEAFTPPEEKPKVERPPEPPAPIEEPIIDEKEFERPKPTPKISGSKKKGRASAPPKSTEPPEITIPPKPIAKPPEPPKPAPPPLPKPDRTRELKRLADIRRTVTDAVLRLRKTENDVKEMLRGTTAELEALQLSIDELEEWIKKP